MGKKISAAAGGLDDRLDVVEVAVEGRAPRGAQAIDGLGTAAIEGLEAGDVLGLFELARMRTQIAVADVEEGFQLAESQLLAHRERTHDAQAHALIDQPI